MDNQISVYLAGCEYFVSRDKAFVDCVHAVRNMGLVPIAKPLSMSYDQSIEHLLAAIGNEARNAAGS